MATRGLGLEHVRRQRWLTALTAAGLSIAGVAVAIALWRASTHKEAPVRLPSSPPADVHQQLSGYTLSRSDGSRTLFTVHAARTVAFQAGGNTVLEDVEVEFFGRQGSHRSLLRTHRCEYNKEAGSFVTPGEVELDLNSEAGESSAASVRGAHTVHLQTSKIAYRQQGSLAETDQPVKFRVGPASGTAVGMAYATKDGWLELKHTVVADLQQDGRRLPIHVTASALRYEKKGLTIALSGPVEVKEGDRRAGAGQALIRLDEHDRVNEAEAEGNVQAFDASPARNMELAAQHVTGIFEPASGQLRHLTAERDVSGESKSQASTSHLTAQRLDLDLEGTPAHPTSGVARGDAHLAVESQPVLKVADKTPTRPGPERKDLTASALHFTFRPDGASLRDAVTEGPGTLLIKPSDPKQGERVITAGQFQMAFDARSHLDGMHGSAPTRVVIKPAPSAPAGTATQDATADQLDAVFETGSQMLREVRQTGNFQYRGGDRQASSEEAHYDAQTQGLLLLGHPQVWDSTTHVKCQRIMMDTKANTATGEGNVQAVHLPAPPPSGTPPRSSSGAATPPTPTNVLADRMVARHDSQTVHYEGHVRSWQGTNVIESSSLDVFQKEHRLSSGSKVVTSYLRPASHSAKSKVLNSPPGAMEPVTISADFLEYFDPERRAHYHGNVRMISEDMTLQSDRLDVYLTRGESAEGSQIDHAVADGRVRVTQPGRRGSSDHAEYFAGPGEIVMTGGNPSLFDTQKGYTAGQRLTVYTQDDRLLVDGGEKSPSLTEHRVVR